MSDAFNPYQFWLGLQVQEPANHYELLGLSLFEADVHAISAAANNAMTRVQGFPPGAHADRWTQLLDEISVAWNCLADATQRQQYDDQLRQRFGGVSPTAMPSRPLPRSADGLMPPGPISGAPGAVPAEGPADGTPMAGYPQMPGQATGVPYGSVETGFPQQPTQPGQTWGAVAPDTYAPTTYPPAAGQPYVPPGQVPGQMPGTVAQPTVNQPAAPQPTVSQPVMGYPTPGQPNTGQPMPGQPMPGQPYAVQPTPVQPYAGQPTPVQPYAVQPTPVQPYAVQPTPVQPYAVQPTPVQPAAGYPVQGYPGALPPAGYPPATPVFHAAAATPPATPPPGVSPVTPPDAGGPQPGNLPSDADPMAPVNHVLVNPVGGGVAGISVTPTASGGAATSVDARLPGGSSALPGAAVSVQDESGEAASTPVRTKKRLGVPLIGTIIGVVLCAAVVGLFCLWGGDPNGSRETANVNGTDEMTGGESADGSTDDPATVPGGASETAGDGQTGGAESAPESANGTVPSSDDDGRQVAMKIDPNEDPTAGGTQRSSTADNDQPNSTDGLGSSSADTNPPVGTASPPADAGPGKEVAVAESPATSVVPPVGRLPGTSGAGAVVPSTDGGSPALPALTERELVELGRALTRARMFVGAQDYGNATRELTRAEQLARLPDHRAKIERLKLLSNYTQQFWAAFRDGLKLLNKPGQELVVGGERVAVVEIDARKIILRAHGQNKTFPMGDLPDKLVMAIADLWFDKGASSTNVFRGAFYATGPNANPAETRRLWEEARRAGADVADLMPFLGDSYDLTADLDR